MATQRTARLRAPSTEAVVPDPPWRTAAAPGWNEVTVIRQRRLGTPGIRAVSVVQHLARLPVWERKAHRMTVQPAGSRHGNYTAAGRIAGVIPWGATFGPNGPGWAPAADGPAAKWSMT